MLLAMIQVKRYQRAVKEMLGTGVLGIGSRRGGIIKPGEIIILSYDLKADRVVMVKSMKGKTVFAKFKEIPHYAGLSLSDIRIIAVEIDAYELKRYKKKTSL
jgi:glucitol operon activator protein